MHTGKHAGIGPALLVLLASSFATPRAHGSYHVGNPGVSLAVHQTGDWRISTTLAHGTMTLQPCHGGSPRDAIQVLGQRHPSLAASLWQLVRRHIRFASDTVIEAIDGEGRHLEVFLEDKTVDILFQTPITISPDARPQSWVAELGAGKWLSLAKQFLHSGQYRLIEHGTPAYDTILEELALVHMYVDQDGDGVLSSSERDAGSLAFPEHELP